MAERRTNTFPRMNIELSDDPLIGPHYTESPFSSLFFVLFLPVFCCGTLDPDSVVIRSDRRGHSMRSTERILGILEPVSVCVVVLMDPNGRRLQVWPHKPTTRWYHIQRSGLMGATHCNDRKFGSFQRGSIVNGAVRDRLLQKMFNMESNSSPEFGLKHHFMRFIRRFCKTL
jgi:hypothetical protein